ncbi:UNVERIFIED_CONTAM: hypothetical protein FKN15_048902 [Acipenser sinensis]
MGVPCRRNRYFSTSGRCSGGQDVLKEKELPSQWPETPIIEEGNPFRKSKEFQNLVNARRGKRQSGRPTSQRPQ